MNGQMAGAGWRRVAARVLIALAALLAAWSLFALASGGVRLALGGLALSSRNPVRPAVAALLLAAIAWRLDRAWTEAAADALRARLSPFTRRVLIPLAAAALAASAVAFGARAAIGADSFGYVSQSVLWLGGDLRIAQPFVALMPWPEADWTFTPLGYRPVDGHVLVPTYAPGLPLLMALARLVSACAPYYVVPLSAALLVIATWRLGARVFGDGVGIAGALMTAASPVVLMWSLSPMTDVPVAALWIAALLAADRPSVKGTLAAGMLGGIAVAIRPNLAPLALFPFLLSMLHTTSIRVAFVRGAALSAAIAPFVLLVAIVNDRLYGSPFVSGYGSASSIYSWRHVGANLRLYPTWWWQAHGVLGCLFVFALFRSRSRDERNRIFVLAAYAAAVVLSYIFYLPFEHWGFLRFMLPAIPVVLLLGADGVRWLTTRLGPAPATCVLAAVAGIAMMQGVHRARWDSFFGNGDAEQRYVDAAKYVDTATPPATVVLAMQHSGSVRYYSGRLTLRYDLLDPAWLERAIDTLDGFGFRTYALLEDWEEEVFRQRFGERAAHVLGAGPIAVRDFPGGQLRLFAIRAPAPANPTPVHMPRMSRFDCIDVSPRFAAPVAIPARP